MRALAVLALVLSACAASADSPPERTCDTIDFDGAPFVVCAVPRDADIRLFHRNAAGDVLGDFDALEAQLAPGETLLMAMNAGMYHADRRAVGLHVENGEESAPIVTSAGPGNFGLLPNGVFWSDGERVHVTETRAFAAGGHIPGFATQSGPMLVIDGDLHPRFLPDSDSHKRRNGVGVYDDTAWFAISDAPVTFHHFARLFRDALGADNALFLDGSISRIRAPELDRDERGSPLGPMVAIIRADTRAPSGPEHSERD